MVPIFNEERTLEVILGHVLSRPEVGEVVAVDDGSKDGSWEILQRVARSDSRVRPFRQETNQGKGAALRLAVKEIRLPFALVQDADLEYDPTDYPILLRPIQTGKARVVYGSRFIGEHKAMYFWHSVGNQSLTLLCNMLFDTTLTDMETCYKVFTIDIARRLRLCEPRWGFDPEITARILRMGNRIYEVPISYAGREFNEGKKISWRDGFVVLVALMRYRFLP